MELNVYQACYKLFLNCVTVTVLYYIHHINGMCLRCMGISPTSATFSKGDNFLDFLLTNLEDEAFKRGLFMMETICSSGEQILFFKN